MGLRLSEYARSLPRRVVQIEIGGQSYPLRLQINQLIAAASILGRPFEQIAPSLADPEVMRAVLWAAMRDDDPDLTLFDAGDILAEVGAEKVGAALSDAIIAAFPEAKPDADPQTAPQGGTGQSS